MLTTTILIVGAGPVGLWLAYDVKRMDPNLDVLVIDSIPSRAERGKFSKAASMSAGTLETFESRGIANLFLEKGMPMTDTHFAGMPIHLSEEILGARHPFNMSLPQAQTEDILLKLCEDVGVRFEWGCELVLLAQDDAVVAVTARKMTENELERGQEVAINAQWVVGCDGCHSKVRKLAGIGFEGTSSTRISTLADIQLSEPVRVMSSRVGAFMMPLGDGVHFRFMSVLDPMDNGEASFDPPTLEEIRGLLQDTFGSDFGAHSPLWMSRFGNACRVAPSFRIGRILLAGDAGHQIFPAGGQGMNLGIQDATSLAWRLVMVADGSPVPKFAMEQMLNSYSYERCEAAKDVIENVQAQMALLTAKTSPEIALREIFRETLKNPQINERWARRLTGFGEAKAGYAYELPKPAMGSSPRSLVHSLIGTRITSGNGMGELYQATKSAKFTFLWATAGGIPTRIKDAFDDVLEAWSDRVTVLSMSAGSLRRRNIVAVVVRPDMRIAWVAKGELPMSTQRSDLVWVLEHWFGSRHIVKSGLDENVKSEYSSFERLKLGVEIRSDDREWSIEGRSVSEIV